MKYIIDRFEDNFAVVEINSQKFVNIPKEAIPQEAKEGDIIDVRVDKEDTA
jgi:transcription elongation factor